LTNARTTGSLMISDEIGQRNCSGTKASVAYLFPPRIVCLGRPRSASLSAASCDWDLSKASPSAPPATTAATSRRRIAVASSAERTSESAQSVECPRQAERAGRRGTGRRRRWGSVVCGGRGSYGGGSDGGWGKGDLARRPLKRPALEERKLPAPGSPPHGRGGGGSLVAGDSNESSQCRLVVRERVKLRRELDRWGHETKMTHAPF
jgi:hypothetical protein